MTREEQIQKASEEYAERSENILEYSDYWQEYNDYEYVEKAFIAGAEWAYKHPFLDEVKEINLNTAVERYIKLHESEFQGYFDIRRIARHFFELGLNSQKGE